MISSDIFDFQQYAFDRRFMKVLCDIINDEKGRIKYFDYASIVLHIQRWTFEIEGHISSHKLILMPILTKTLIAAWENECHPKESPSLPRGRTLLPWRPKSTWIAGTKSTLAGPNYHLLGEQKIPGFKTIVCFNLSAPWISTITTYSVSPTSSLKTSAVWARTFSTK